VIPALGSSPGLRRALLRYRLLAFAVGTGLLALVLVGMPLQFFAGNQDVVQVVGPIHGFLYIVYLLAAADLARRCRWRIQQLVPVILAGLVPFLAFVVERRVSARLKAGADPSG
jgi:integral membrane protein